jgi:acetyltransferase-like isoleucine patch superfamily enzyme
MIVAYRQTLANYSLKQLFVRIAEEYVWWLIRSWPGFEGVFLRYLFLKATTKRLDGFCWISQGCSIANSFNLSIGKNFNTNRNVLLDALGEIEIGDNTAIGPNTVIISHEHSMLTADHFTSSYKKAKVAVGSDVWIGSNCFIKAGVTIGNGAVVGACSNVVRDVPERAAVIGSPARPYTDAMRELLRKK